MGYPKYELPQHLERKEDEEQIISPLVPSPKVIATQEIFPRFVPSIENSVAILDTYTYYLISKKVS